MICDHPQCTGKHKTTLRKAEMCPAAWQRWLAAKRVRWHQVQPPKPRREYPPCCQDAGGRQCPQHAQWVRARNNRYGTSPREVTADGEFMGTGFSVRRNPDAYWPGDEEDRAQEKAIGEWLSSSRRSAPQEGEWEGWQ